MELGLHMQRKRDATQMSAAAVSFYLDKESHSKFLRVSTNQELEAENTKLKDEVEENKTFMVSKSRTIRELRTDIAYFKLELESLTKQRDSFKKAWLKQRDALCKARELEKNMRKVLDPDISVTEVEEDQEPTVEGYWLPTEEEVNGEAESVGWDGQSSPDDAE